MQKNILLFLFFAASLCAKAQNWVFHVGGGLATQTSHHRAVGAFKVGVSYEHEFNGMWSLENFVTSMPSLFAIYEIITTVNGETFEMYINNMGVRMIEHIAAADMIVFNRCDEERKEKKR